MRRSSPLQLLAIMLCLFSPALGQTKRPSLSKGGTGAGVPSTPSVQTSPSLPQVLDWIQSKLNSTATNFVVPRPSDTDKEGHVSSGSAEYKTTFASYDGCVLAIQSSWREEQKLSEASGKNYLKFLTSVEFTGPVSLGDLDLASIQVSNAMQGVELHFSAFNNVPKFTYSYARHTESWESREWKTFGTDANDSHISSGFLIHVQDAEMATRLAHALSDAARLCHAHEPVKDLY